jgi:hypothetical protein
VFLKKNQNISEKMLEYYLGKRPFLTIQLLLKFGFDYRTPKRLFLFIKLSKPFKFGHWAVLMGGFKFFIYNLVLRTSNDYYFLLVHPI